MTLNEWASEIRKLNVEKGWENDWNLGEKLFLVASELVEAFEEYRNGDLEENVCGMVYFSTGEYALSFEEKLKRAQAKQKPEGFPIEIADAFIRLLHVCAYYGIDIEKMIELKHEYNKTRPYRHGNKLA